MQKQSDEVTLGIDLAGNLSVCQILTPYAHFFDAYCLLFCIFTVVIDMPNVCNCNNYIFLSYCGFRW